MTADFSPDSPPRKDSASPRLREYLKRILHIGQERFRGHETAFLRPNAFMLSYVVLGLLALMLCLNIFEKKAGFAAILAVTLAVPAISLAWLWLRKEAGAGPLLLLVSGLMFMGLWLLLRTSASESSSLYWLIIFPTMVMLSMGLRLGSLVFGVYYLILLVLFLTPLSRLLPDPIDMPMRVRFLFAMFGAFVFSWWAEYLRDSTRRALRRNMERLEEEARTDSLTGLGNRRDFETAFAWVAAKFRRDLQPFALAIIDLDHFKRVNDTYGHEVGDKVLLHVAGAISRHIRASDRLFRWGGEEFTMLMPGVDDKAARMAAERVRMAVAAAPYRHKGTDIVITVSIGLCFGDNCKELDDAMTTADRNLYKAKRGGRDRVVG